MEASLASLVFPQSRPELLPITPGVRVPQKTLGTQECALGLSLPSAPPRGRWGSSWQGSQRSPLLPLSSLNYFCFPLSFLFWLQSTCRCGAVGHNQGSQVRNGAWQPLACTRLPECNFPIITLPNFSASVKDHLLTQQSQAPAGQEARPFARNHFQQAEKTHSLFSFRHVQCPRGGEPRGPTCGSGRPGVSAPATPSPSHALSDSSHPSRPRFSAAPSPPITASLTSSQLSRSSSRMLAGSVSRSLTVTFIGSPTLSPLMPPDHCGSISSNHHPPKFCTSHPQPPTATPSLTVARTDGHHFSCSFLSRCVVPRPV